MCLLLFWFGWPVFQAVLRWFASGGMQGFVGVFVLVQSYVMRFFRVSFGLMGGCFSLGRMGVGIALRMCWLVEKVFSVLGWRQRVRAGRLAWLGHHANGGLSSDTAKVGGSNPPRPTNFPPLKMHR